MKDYNNNDKYMKMSGLKSGKVMKNHGNTQKVKSDNQKFDMKRMQWLGHELKGYNEKAYEYKY